MYVYTIFVFMETNGGKWMMVETKEKHHIQDPQPVSFPYLCYVPTGTVTDVWKGCVHLVSAASSVDGSSSEVIC